MSSVRELHNRAMTFVDQGLRERAHGNTELAIKLFRNALDNEMAAIDSLSTQSGLGWSVLHRSAATLALDCEEFRLAEKLASTALAGDPYPEIADELRNVLQQANSYRHLELRGVELAPDEMQMSLSGGDVGHGFIAASEFTTRIENVSKLFSRTVERLHNRPFRKRGRMPKSLVGMSEVFVSTPRAASFAVTVKLSSPIKKPSSHEELEPSAIVDEFMDLMGLVNNSRIEEIHKRIPDIAYLRNLLDLAKKIAPDGDRVRQVGFTSIRYGEEHSVEFIRPAAEISPQPAVPIAPLRPTEPQSLIGTLIGADVTRPNNALIKITDDSKRTYQFHVHRGRIDRIVRPLWHSRVAVTYSRRGNRMILEDISPSETS